MNWWESTFSKTYADVFHRLFPEPTEQEVEQISKWFPVSSYTTVLDLACGEGRHGIGLAKDGYQVTGVDLSDAFLETAKQRALQLSNPPHFLKQDMRSMNLSQAFDLVLLIGNSFGYGSDADQQAVLDRAAEHLAVNGSFLLAMPNGLRSMCAFKKEDSIEKSFELDREEIVIKETYSFDAITSIKTSIWSILKKGEIIFEEQAKVRFYTMTEVVQMLERAGFVCKKIFGDYQEQPFTKESPFFVIVAERK